MAKDFEVLSHTADLLVRSYGKDLKELLQNSLKGMFLSIRPQSSECSYDENDRLVCDNLTKKRDIEVQSHDIDSLLVDFLSEALYLSDVHKEAYFDVNFSDFKSDGDFYIKGELLGIGIQNFDAGEIKAVTHHGLKVEKKGDVWTAEVLFDM